MSAPVFRLAIRDRGEFVHFYFAQPDTIADALLLMTVRKVVLWNDAAFYSAIRQALRDHLDRAAEAVTGMKRGRWTDLPGRDDGRPS